MIKIGKYYTTRLNRELDRFFIILITGLLFDGVHKGFMISNMNTGNFVFYSGSGCLRHSDRITTESTQEEIDWLDECIRQNKFVPLEVLNNEYSFI